MSIYHHVKSLASLEADPCHSALEGGGGPGSPFMYLRPWLFKYQPITQPTQGLGTGLPTGLFPVVAAQPLHPDSSFWEFGEE